MNIKAIIFDWGGVLHDYKNDEFISFFSKKFSLNRKKYREFWIKKNDDMCENKITFNEFLSLMNKQFSLNLTENEYLKLYSKYKGLRSRLLERIKKLKGKYKLAILSNNYRKLYLSDVFPRKQLKKIFSVIMISCFYGIRKPNKKIYKICLKKLGVSPHEAIFIDDKLENIKAAKSLGIKAIQFKSLTQMKNDLKKYGIRL